MKNSKLYIAILSAALSSNFLHAEAEVTGKVIHESAEYLYDGTSTGTTTAHDNEQFKSETRLKVFIDGEVNDDMTYHIEAQGFKDSKAVANHQSSKSYTKRDPLRDAYIDTNVNDWALRLGKQQVVWGTADGAKLLDIINPTDYTEMAQDQMEDSRIPVWMINGEKIQEDGSSIQVIVSEPRENIFAGLDRNISQVVRTPSNIAGHNVGHPFILKGVDSITGKKNGFLNIAPEIGALGMGFYNTFSAAVGTSATGGGLNDSTALGASTTTVGTFATAANGTGAAPYDGNYGYTIQNYGNSTSGGLAGDGSGANVLNAFIGGYGYSTNLQNATTRSNWGSVDDSAFEYMENTVFGTFDTLANAGSKYRYNMPDSSDADLGIRYTNTLANGLNYSLNYSNAYAKDPIINLSWEYSDGTKLTKSVNSDNKILLHDGSSYVSAQTYTAARRPILVFEQTVERADNIGGSLDYGLDTEMFGPVVIRGEAVYQKGVYSPVMNLASLSIGDLTDALTMVKGDRFKYVIGADFTADTNMMVSLQFIQDRNLDYIDTTSTKNNSVSGAKYTTDYATMHLTNGFNKAAENKNFYSLYLSKPFGESGQHRWSNITMIEETGGRWNRADVEYTLDDNTVLTSELNTYWGDKNTQFGQLEDSSNIQVGVKYSF